MGLISDEQKFSGGKVVRLEMKAFFKSKAAADVGEGDDVKMILRLYLECYYIYHEMAPKEMDAASFKDVAHGTFPRRFMGDEKYLKKVPQVVRAYQDYLKDNIHLNDLPRIEKSIDDLEKKFSKLVKGVKKADRLPDDPPTEQIVRDDTKLGRNDPCPCGSGKKYKKCCLQK